MNLETWCVFCGEGVRVDLNFWHIGYCCVAMESDCPYCDKLRKKGKFPKKCIHKHLKPSGIPVVEEPIEPQPSQGGRPTHRRELWLHLMQQHEEPLANFRRGVSRLTQGRRRRVVQPVHSRHSSIGSGDASAASGGSISVLQEDNVSVLFEAAADGDLPTVKRMILNGASVGAIRPADGKTLLHMAAANGRLRVVEFLIQENVDVNVKDSLGLTALQHAMQNLHTEVADYLKRYGAEDEAKSWSENVSDLVVKGDLETLATMFASNKRVFREMIDSYRDLLHRVVGETGNLEVLKFLVQEVAADPNRVDSNGLTPLDLAIQKGSSAMVEILRKVGAEESSSLAGVLIFKLCDAANRGDLHEVTQLIQNGADANGHDYDFRTPLHLAAAGGSFEVVKYLVENGAHREVQDRWGSDPYQEALRYKHEEIAEYLDQGGKFSFKKELLVDDFSEREEKDKYECCGRFGVNRDAVHSVIQLVLQAACEVGNWSYADFWTVDLDSLLMKCCETANFISTDNMRISAQSLSTVSKLLPIECMLYFNGQVIRKGEVVFKENLKDVRQSEFPLAPAAMYQSFQSCVCIPVTAKCIDEIIGSAVFYSPDVRGPNFLTKELLSLEFGADALALEALIADERITREDYSLCLRVMTTIDDTRSYLGSVTGDKESIYHKIKSPSNIEQLSLAVSLLTATGGLARALSWALTLDSEDHKAALSILIALSLTMSHLTTDLQDRIFNDLHYDMALKFLVTVSPLERQNSPVRDDISQAIERLRSVGLFRDEPPYFGPGKPFSPVLSAMEQFKSELSVTLSNFTKKEEMLKMRNVEKPEYQEFPARFVFQTCGQKRSGGSSRFQDDEHEKIAKFATELLRNAANGPLVTIENVKKMHKLMELESDVDAGQFRKSLVVGSHMFYRFYRTFAPFEEVEGAMERFVEEVNSPAMADWNGVQKAFFVFASIVMFIHPFEDGNGRLGRMFANMLLIQDGYPSVFQYSHKVITFGEVLELVWEKMNRLNALFR
jgi:ankyrin repeat protein/fido (protein-threonine AMPylation protein)